MKQQKKILRGEAALVLAVIINSLGVLLMLQSGSGISAISSVPYAFQQVFPKLTLGTWTYLFQGLLICILMIMRKKFVPSYLFSFVVGFAFGEMMDLHELWITRLPLNIPLRILYFVLSYLIICFGIALSNRCKLPIIPTDLFPREAADITKVPYARIKIGFDVTCLVITACMTFFCLGHIMGLGIGTIVAAFTMGRNCNYRELDGSACGICFPVVLMIHKLLNRKFFMVFRKSISNRDTHSVNLCPRLLLCCML